MIQKFDISDRISPSIGLISKSRNIVIDEEFSDPKHLWFVFVLQFLIWWTSWTLIDSVPDLLGFSHLSSIQSAQWNAVTIIVGALMHRIPMSISPNTVQFKVKSLAGFILTCYGLWGTFDLLTQYLSDLSGIRPVSFRLFLFGVSAGLGCVHHQSVHRDFLIDNMF